MLLYITPFEEKRTKLACLMSSGSGRRVRQDLQALRKAEWEVERVNLRGTGTAGSEEGEKGRMERRREGGEVGDREEGQAEEARGIMCRAIKSLAQPGDDILWQGTSLAC